MSSSVLVLENNVIKFLFTCFPKFFLCSVLPGKKKKKDEDKFMYMLEDCTLDLSVTNY